MNPKIQRLHGALVEHLPYLVPRKRGGIHHLLFAAVLTGLAAWLRLTIAEVDQGLQYVVFFPAVTLAAIVGGYRAGMFATLLGLALANYIFVAPYYAVSIETLQRALWPNLIFLIDGLIVSYAIEAMHRYGQQYRHERDVRQATGMRNATLQKIIEASPVPMLLHDQQQNIALLNPAFEQTIGYALTDIPTITDYRLKAYPDPAYRRWVADAVQSQLDNPPATAPLPPLELRVQCKNGDIKTVLANFRFIDDAADDLWLAVLFDITERKRMEDALRTREQDYRALAARLETTSEAERKHISREIHDELGQVLSALRMGVSMLRVKHGSAWPELTHSVQDIMVLVDRTIQTVRDVASRLRPSALDMGVVPALEWLLSEYRTHSGLQCELQANEADMALDEAQATAVFRIVQEALTNVVRHADAHRVSVALAHHDGELRLTIRDDGRGFDPTQRRANAYGLVGIRERAEMMGGSLSLSSAAGLGTKIEVCMPSGAAPS